MKSLYFKFVAITILTFSTFLSLHSQINGTQANDWTMTDIDGNTWNLYSLLNDGKIVYLDFSATWCGICWNFHNSHAFENIYNQYGPDGTDEVMVFFIELDSSTDEACLYGSAGCNGNSSGNWTAGVSYPIISASDQDVANLSSEYNVIGYPSLNVVCSSGRKFELPTTNSAAFLSNYIQSCGLSIDSVDVTDSECNGEPSGAIDLSVSGGYNNLTYTWSNGDETEDLTDLEAGTYSCTVRDGNQVFVTTIVEVYSPSPDLNLSVDIYNAPSCYDAADGQIEVSGNGGSGYTYTWDDGTIGATRDNLPAGTYVVTLEDNNGCTSVEEIILEDPIEILASTEVTSQGCDTFGSAIINVTQGEGNFTYNIGEGDQTSNVFEDLIGGDYTYTVTNGDGCIFTSEFTIEQEDVPYIEGPTEGLFLNCGEESLVIDYSNSATGGNITYSWMTTDGTISSDSSSSIVTVTESGTYTFTITDITTNCSQSVSLVIEENNLPLAVAGEDHTLLCDYSNYIIHSDDSSSGEDFLINWTTTDGIIIGGEHTLQPLTNGPGTYVLNITDINNQCTANDTTVITLYDNTPEADFNIEKNVYTAVFTSESEGDNNAYLWDFGDDNTSTLENPTHNYNGPGTYNVCLTTTNECGMDQKCRSLSINAVEISISSEITDVSCHGEADGAISIENTSDLIIETYSWSSGQTTADIDGLSGGEYILTLTSQEGISATYDFTVQEADELIAEVANIDDQNGDIDINISGGVPPYKITWNNGSQDEDQSGLSPGTYAVSIKDAQNCRTEITGIIIATTSINDVSLRSNIDLYPNPVKALLLLDFKSNIKGNGSIKIYNTEGKEVYSEKIETFGKSLQIDLNHLSSGYYYIRLITLNESAIINFIKT